MTKNKTKTTNITAGFTLSSCQVTYSLVKDIKDKVAASLICNCLIIIHLLSNR